MTDVKKYYLVENISNRLFWSEKFSSWTMVDQATRYNVWEHAVDAVHHIPQSTVKVVEIYE